MERWSDVEEAGAGVGASGLSLGKFGLGLGFKVQLGFRVLGFRV